MTQAPRLELRQQQSLVMTAQLQQSIKLLQLSSLELAEFVEQEVEKNPLLELEGEKDTLDDGLRERDASDAPEAQDRDVDRDVVELTEGSQLDTRDALLDTGGDGEWDGSDYLSEPAFESRAAASGGNAETLQQFGHSGIIEQTASEEASLKDHLLQQLQMDIGDPAQRLIGRFLIDLVDDTGYLSVDLEAVAEQLKCEPALLEGTLARMQRFDPAGIFARSLSECLTIQLRERDRFDPAMEALIQHLDLLAAGEFDRLKARCGVDREDLQEMIAEIRLLDPKPASRFTVETSQAIEPDVLVQTNKSGDWHVELNSHTLPRVLVNRRYHAQLSGQTQKKEDKKFLSEQISSANWLTKALDQRAHTVLKVATEIVRRQDGFFRHGIAHLQPLTLREVAEEVELHESTVSRVTSNKFMVTPCGTFELKYFFTSSVHSMSASGTEGDISSRTVKHYIRELTDQEPPEKILSDDALTALLQEKGIDIARRTVAKYREALHIPSSVQRRRQKKLLCK